MKSSTFITCTLALAALGASPLLLAKDRAHGHAHQRQTAMQMPSEGGFDHGMQPVLHAANVGEPGHGWQYFSDPAHARAVVISPDGQYYLSRGKGLRWVAGAPI